MLIDALFHSSSAPALAVALVVAGFVTLLAARIQNNRKIQKLGGRAVRLPSIFFGIDSVWRAMKYARQNRNRELWEARFKELGVHTTEMSIVGNRVIFTTEPENIKAILATQFHDFGKGETFHEQWRPFLGDSIFTTDGKQWAESRALIRPQFIKDRVSDLHCFERHVQHMFKQIPMDGSTIRIDDLIFRFTLDSATEFLMGQSVNSIENPQVEFSTAFAKIQVHMNNVSRAGPLAWCLPAGDFKKNLKILNAFVEPFVQRTLQMQPGDLKDKKETDYNFLHALAEYTRDPVMLRDQLVAVLLAARDTSAGTMSWTMWEMAKQPRIVQKLRREILERVGPVNAPTYQDLKEMKYLQAIINETLRLYPAVPFNVRVALKDTSLPRGNAISEAEPIGVRAGTVCAYSTLIMQRRKDLFSNDVDQFIPERWDNGPPKSWHYVPFNGGPRICIGQQFALTEMAYFICRLFQRFEALEDRQPDVVQCERCEITITPGKGVKVGLRPAKI